MPRQMKTIRWSGGGWYINRAGNPVLQCGNTRIVIDLEANSISDLSSLSFAIRRKAAKRINEKTLGLKRELRRLAFDATNINEQMEVE